MSINQQHALDVYRASLHGEPAPAGAGRPRLEHHPRAARLPPFPRGHRFYRPAHGRILAALSRLIHPHRGAAGC